MGFFWFCLSCWYFQFFYFFLHRSNFISLTHSVIRPPWFFFISISWTTLRNFVIWKISISCHNFLCLSWIVFFFLLSFFFFLCFVQIWKMHRIRDRGWNESKVKYKLKLCDFTCVSKHLSVIFFLYCLLHLAKRSAATVSSSTNGKGFFFLYFFLFDFDYVAFSLKSTTTGVTVAQIKIITNFWFALHLGRLVPSLRISNHQIPSNHLLFSFSQQKKKIQFNILLTHFHNISSFFPFYGNIFFWKKKDGTRID